MNGHCMDAARGTLTMKMLKFPAPSFAWPRVGYQGASVNRLGPTGKAPLRPGVRQVRSASDQTAADERNLVEGNQQVPPASGGSGDGGNNGQKRTANSPEDGESGKRRRRSRRSAAMGHAVYALAQGCTDLAELIAKGQLQRVQQRYQYIMCTLLVPAGLAVLAAVLAAILYYIPPKQPPPPRFLDIPAQGSAAALRNSPKSLEMRKAAREVGAEGARWLSSAGWAQSVAVAWVGWCIWQGLERFGSGGSNGGDQGGGKRVSTQSTPSVEPRA